MDDIVKEQTEAEAVEVIESLLRDLKPYVKSFNSVIDQADEAVANPMGYDVVGVAEELEELLDFCETNREMFQMTRPVFFK